MDRIFFVVKRAHHATLKFARPVLATFGLTPARFDLLYALTEDGIETTQMALRHALGVARSTISEMLAALERLGFIERTRDRDRRTLVVTLTQKGQAILRSAVAATMDSGFVPLTVDGILARGDVDVDSASARQTFESDLQRWQVAFGDFTSYWLYRADLDLIDGSLLELEDPFDEFLT